MTIHDLHELANRYSFDVEELQELQEKYPTAKKDFVEQVLHYIKSHGVGFSFATNLMEMDKELLMYYGLSAVSSNEHVLNAGVKSA